MQIHYLEIVTPDVEGVCNTYTTATASSFGEPVPALGNARVAELVGGGMVGVRAPMHESETPVTRPYFLVDDIEAALAGAVAAGAEVAHPAMELPNLGTFAIYIQGGIHHGLWQL
ncbi:MAG: hypothetical protein DHS20C11_06730 [Lysobacteraceae bacterium]|nr:MAG: hypothetical protein DHS20C11_06730 [Xanthomonadaceae bacterium]